MRAVWIALVLAGGVAHAEPSMPSAPMFTPVAEPSSDDDDDDATYRSHVAITSALGLGMLVAVPLAEDASPNLSDGLAVTGMLTSTLVPLVVHGLHGEPERGFASLGTRVAGFVGGMYAAKELAGCADLIFCDQSLWGGLVGLSVASAIDIAFFAKGNASERRERVIAPTVTASPTGGQVGVAGMF